METGLDKLLDTMLTFMDEGVKIEKVKMKRTFYDKHNEERKRTITVKEDASTILGVPIEIDDMIKSDYVIEIRTQ